jgi:Fe2+ or Zn2+ uptake regulation protein
MYDYIYCYTNSYMNQEERRKSITDYISNNEGCTAEDIVEGLKAEISRAPIFDTLRVLVKEDIVKDDRTNRRDHKFFVNNNNLLVSTINKLDEFKTYYYHLLDKAYEKIWEIYISNSSNDVINQISAIMCLFIDIFFEVASIYNYYALLIWPRRIKDREYLKKLYNSAFSKITDIKIEVFERFEFFYPDERGLQHFLPRERLATICPFPPFEDEHEDHLLAWYRDSRVFGLHNEVVPILGYITDMYNELHS